MHKLDRNKITEPKELKNARENHVVDWEHFNGHQKKKVRDALLTLQSNRCAYCEQRLHNISTPWENKWDGHIEHFRRKDPNFNPELTFVWQNLFYSCLTSATCGIRKDRFIKNKLEYDFMVDPCKDNPEDYFIFDHSGRISARSKLSKYKMKKALFTIEAFNLNAPQLVNMRKNILSKHAWIAQYPQHIGEYLLHIKDEEFITAIYHYFGRRVN